MQCQQAGGHLADMADAERAEQPGQRHGAALCEHGEHIARRLLPPAVERSQSLPVEPEKIGDFPDQPLAHQLFDLLFPQPFQVQAALPCEIDEPLQLLRRALPVHTAGDRRLRLPLQPLRAFRALLGEDDRPLRAVAPGRDGLDDLRDDVAGPLDKHRVADAQILPADLVLVVQGRTPDHGAGDLHWREQGHRGDRPGAAHLELDRFDDRGRLHRRELPGDRPARRPGGRTEALLESELVDLDHHAVDVVVEFMTQGHEFLVPLFHLGKRAAHPHQRVERQPQAAEPVEQLPLTACRQGFGVADAIDEKGQRASGGDARVQLAQRPGRGVAGVGEQRLALLLPLAVEQEKSFLRQKHLAAHVQLRRPARSCLRVEAERDGRHSLQLGGDVFAALAVTPGGAHLEQAVAVDQFHGQAVQLRLGDVAHRLVEPQKPLHPLGKGGELGRGKDVVQAEHGGGVPNRRKARKRWSADPVTGRVGGDQFRMPGFDREQLPEQLVVLAV